MIIREGEYTPLGYGQFSVDASTAKSCSSTAANGSNITTVEGTNRVSRVIRLEVVPEQAIRFRLDGTAPTASIGTPIPAGAQYIVNADPYRFQFISQSGTATVNIEFLGL
jgi:hypothetical protein